MYTKLFLIFLLFLTDSSFAQFKNYFLVGAIRSETPVSDDVFDRPYTDPGFGLKAGFETRFDHKIFSTGINLNFNSTKYTGKRHDTNGKFQVRQFTASPFVSIKPIRAINLQLGLGAVLYVDLKNELIDSHVMPSSGGKYWAGKLFANYEYRRFGIELAYVKFYDYYYYYYTSTTSPVLTKVYCYFSNIELTLKYNFFQYPTK